MKVLHVLNELRPSGAEVMLEAAAPIWRELGCELHLLSMSPNRGQLADRLEEAGWQIELAGEGCKGRAAAASVRRALRRLRPDLVHFHPEGSSIFHCWAAWRCGVPMVRTVHNNFGFTGALRWRKRAERLLSRSLGMQFVSISSSVRDNERSRFANPTTLIWNWVDPGKLRLPTPAEKQAARQSLDLPEDRRVLVSVGNSSPVKNYAAIIRALAPLGEKRLLYCQVGNPDPEGADGELVRELGLEGNVRLAGPSDRVRDWLWACDLFVMPSLHEGMPIAAVEALAAGCECLFSVAPGLADFGNLGIDARWCQPQADSIAAALGEWLSAVASEKSAVTNSEIVGREFGVKRQAGKYFDLWRQAVRS